MALTPDQLQNLGWSLSDFNGTPTWSTGGATGLTLDQWLNPQTQAPRYDTSGSADGSSGNLYLGRLGGGHAGPGLESDVYAPLSQAPVIQGDRLYLPGFDPAGASGSTVPYTANENGSTFKDLLGLGEMAGSIAFAPYLSEAIGGVTGLTGASLGAATGATESLATGGNPLIGAATGGAGSALTGGGAAADGAVEPWMGGSPTVETGGGGTFAAVEPWMGSASTTETGGGGVMPAGGGSQLGGMAGLDSSVTSVEPSAFEPEGGAGVGPVGGAPDGGGIALMPPAGTSGDAGASGNLAAAGASQPILGSAAGLDSSVTSLSPSAFSPDLSLSTPELSAGFPSGTGGGAGLTADQAGDGSLGGGDNSSYGDPGSGDITDPWEKARTIGSKLLTKITDNPLTAASVGLMGYNAINQRKAANAVPNQLRSIAGPSAATSAKLMTEADSGPLAGLPAKLIDQATTGPAAAESAALVDQSKTGALATAANDIMAQYASGKINPGTEFDINKWEQQQIAAAKNYYAKAGIPDSSAANNAIAQVQAQATAMRDNARQSLLTSGISATTANLGISAQGLQWAQLAQNMITQGLNVEQVRQNLVRLGLSADQISQTLTVAAVEQQAAQDKAFQASQSSALQSLILLQALSKGTPTAGVGAK